MGWGAWRIIAGRFGTIILDQAQFAFYYKFPGSIEHGQGTACPYTDSGASQKDAIDAIGIGKAGGGIFELRGVQLVTTWLPTKVVPIKIEINDGTGRVCVYGDGEAESELLTYPDGTVIRRCEELPHGIEFKRGLLTNAKRWSWQHAELLASYANRYGAVTKVKLTEGGCVVRPTTRPASEGAPEPLVAGASGCEDAWRRGASSGTAKENQRSIEFARNLLR